MPGDRFSFHFGDRLSVLCVIHVSDARQAIHNAQLAFDCGADGIFLIGHSQTADGLESIIDDVRATFPDRWIGANFLGLAPVDGAKRVIRLGLEGLWADNGTMGDPAAVMTLLECATARRPMFFGGVEFKHQPSTGDARSAAACARPLMDVVTTSGPETGRAADIQKIRLMRAGVSTGRLAIASGVTPENVADYAPYVDAVLVATGVSASFHVLDGERVAALVRRAQR